MRIRSDTLLPTTLATLVLASMLAPVASAQSTSAEETTSMVTFYGHLFGFGREGARSVMPMNTQFPYGEQDLSQGTTAHGCGVPGHPTCEDDTGNEAWFYTTAGFVQIKEYTQFSYDKLHNERGLTKDTKLDTSKDITATFYMSADMHGWLLLLSDPGAPNDFPWPIPGWNWDPGYLPQWQVEATVFTGVLGEHGGAATESPDIAAAFADGKLVPLATGVSDPIDVQSLEPAGQPTVWRFDINLGPPERNTIAKEESYVVRFKWWSIGPDGNKVVVPEVMTWNVNSGEFYPPTVSLPVKGAFNVEMVLPQFVYDKLVLLGIMNTPWGSYDVDHDSVKLTIKSESGTIIEPKSISRLADFSVAHDGHYKPVNVTYVWDYKADNLAPGTYQATVSANNFQNSARASCTAEFTVGAGGAPAGIKVGECGTRTISDDQLDNIKEGSAQDASKPSGGAGDAPRLALPSGGASPIALQAAAVTPVGGASFALVPLAVLALALITRRCLR